MPEACEIPKLDEIQKIEENLVHGCMSTVYMTLELTDDKPQKIKFNAESDTWVVNGLIAILRIVYDGLTLQELSETDIKDVFMNEDISC